MMRTKRLFIVAFLLCSAVAAPAGEPDKKDAPKPVAVKFDVLKTQHMVIDVKINGKGPFRLIFDTGAPITLINNRVAKEADVFPKDFKKPVFTFFGNMGQFKIKEMEVGDLKVDNLSTMVMDHPTVEAISKALGPIEGIVGMSFFGKYRMTLDYRDKVMTFVPVKYDPPDMMQTMMKMLLAPKRDKQIVSPGGLLGIQVDKAAGDEEPGVNVKAVLEDGPAAKAGFEVGDRLLVLDSRWTDSVVDCFHAAAKLEPGRSATATVLRKGKKMNLKVTVEAGL